MKHLILFSCFLLFCIGACTTMAQRQAISIRENMKIANQRAETCFQQVITNSVYQNLDEHTPLLNERPTLEQLISTDKISDSDIKLLIQLHNDNAVCRAQVVEDYMKFLPGIVPIITEYFNKLDFITADLIQRKITWGEANKIRMAVKDEFLADFQEAGKKIDRELAQSHQAELANRRVAINAWMQYQQNQQLINNLNRPVSTHCTTYGNSTNCLSY